MHTADNAHDEAALLCAIHEGHQDLATFLYVANSLHLLHVAKGSTGLRKAGDVGNGGGLLWRAEGDSLRRGRSAPWTAGTCLGTAVCPRLGSGMLIGPQLSLSQMGAEPKLGSFIGAGLHPSH